MTASIRIATPADAEALTRVHIGAWLTTYKGIIPDTELVKRTRQTAQRVQRWRDDLALSNSPRFVFVAETDEGVIGFATGGPERDGDPVYKGEMWGIYILEAWQRRGIGRRLTAAVARELQRRGVSAMLVWVLKDNPYRAFYERLGGAPVKEKEIAFGEAKLPEVSYGWRDIEDLLALLEQANT